MIDSHQTLAHTVVEYPACAAVFRRNQLDFCCHGDISIADAAVVHRLELGPLLAELEAAVAAAPSTPALQLRTLSTPRLVAQIVATHHEYLRRTLPEVQAMAAKVHRVHGERKPALAELAAVVEALAATLLPHIQTEEDVLFPVLCAAHPDRAALAPELHAMEDEHRAVAALFERMQVASDRLTAPEWACGTYRMLLAELGRLEADTFTHVHLENHVLFPRFAEEARSVA